MFERTAIIEIQAETETELRKINQWKGLKIGGIMPLFCLVWYFLVHTFIPSHSYNTFIRSVTTRLSSSPWGYILWKWNDNHRRHSLLDRDYHRCQGQKGNFLFRGIFWIFLGNLDLFWEHAILGHQINKRFESNKLLLYAYLSGYDL